MPPVSRPLRFSINGKFTGAHMTGVQRVAMEIVRELDLLESATQIELLIPKSAPAPELKALTVRRVGTLKGSLWEQIELPWHARKSVLLNLCNLGPALSLGAVTMVHDAQVHATPKSYSAAFRLWYSFIQPWLGHHNQLILSVSEFSKQELVRYGIAPTDKIRVVHNGVDHVLRLAPDAQILKRLNLTGRGYVVGLANIQSHKNIKVLLEAFTSHLSDLKLVLFGRADRDALQTLTNVALDDNIIAAGPVSDEEMVALMENALCIAFPSRTEGFGLPPLEAMLLGCPAVVAPCGALPEVCGDAALYADPDQPTEWAAHIAALRDDPQLRQSYVDAGRLKAADYTWKAAAEKIIALMCNAQIHKRA